MSSLEHFCYTIAFLIMLGLGISIQSTQCILHPILKREGLEAGYPANYRLMANVVFLSKILECIIVNQLIVLGY